MLELFAFLGSSVVALAPAPAGAQTSGVTQHFLACLATRQPQDVRTLLSTSDAETARHAYEHLAHNSRCFSESVGDRQFLPDEMSFSMGVMRGTFAEQALIAEPAKVAALQLLPLQQKRYLRAWFAATGRNAAVDEMAACMADTDSAGIMVLLRTLPGSSQESAAIGELSPSIGKCLSAGTRLDADPRGLRSALADALYQRVRNPSLSMPNSPEQHR